MVAAVPDDQDQTTLHVRRAIDGEALSVDWVVERFTPLLHAQARYRLSKQLQAVCSAGDLVNEVWAIVLPKLGKIVERDGRSTPVFVKYLSSTLNYRLSDLIKRHIRGKPKRVDLQGDEDGGGFLANLPDEATGVATRFLAEEHKSLLTESIERLGRTDREIVVLRGIEQLSYGAIAVLLEVEEGTVRVRYHRALQRLRTTLSEEHHELFVGE